MPLKISNLGASEPAHIVVARFLDALPDGEVMVAGELEQHFPRSNIRSMDAKLSGYSAQRVVPAEFGGTGRLQRIWGSRKTIKELESK